MQKLMADIEADASTARRVKTSFNLGEWLSDKLSSFSPRTLAWSATAAALAIVLQAGLLAGMFVNEKQGGSLFEPPRSPERARDQAWHRCADQLRPAGDAAEITKLLQTYKMAIVEGPSGEMYTVRSRDRHAEGRDGAGHQAAAGREDVRFVGQKSAE
jgi:hypothetical protein